MTHDLLIEFKEAGVSVAAACMVGNVNAIRIASIWPLVSIKWSPPSKLPADKNARWTALWECCEYDVEAVAQTAGIGKGTAWVAIRLLGGARLIYPDGTVDPTAEQVVKHYIAKSVKK